MTTKQAITARVERIQTAVGARNTITEEHIVEALMDGDAAFCFTATYHNQPGSLFVSAVNRLRSIEDAQEELRPFFDRQGWDVESEHWLKLLLPLNRAAVLMLIRAYQNAGSWIMADEVERNTERYEFAQTFSAHSNLVDALDGVSAVAAE